MIKINETIFRVEHYIISMIIIIQLIICCVLLCGACIDKKLTFECTVNNVESINLNKSVKENIQSTKMELMDSAIEPVVEVEITQESEIISISAFVTSSPEVNDYVYYDIPLSDELQEYTQDICNTYSVDSKLIFALMNTESAYTIDIVSKTNDYGLLQINKYNHKWLSEELDITDFLDAKSNILAGVYMMNECSKYAWDEISTLMCYNLGVGGARKKWDKGVYSTGYTDKVMKVKNELVKRK